MGSNRGVIGRLTSVMTLAAFVSASLPSVVHAQGVGVSEQLYRQGQELMKDGKVHEACAKFAASYRADSTAVGSLLATAACHEKEGKVAAAWGEYSAVAVIAQRNGEADRQAYANDHAKALEPRLHHVTLTPQFSTSSTPDGMSIQLDGTAIDVGALNTPIPIDSGDHALSVTAPGKKPWTKQFKTVDNAQTDVLQIPALVDQPKEASGGTQTIIVHDETTSHWNKTRLGFGIMFGVLALGGIGTAVGLGLDASSLDSRSHANPQPANATQLHDTAKTVQIGAIASGIFGGLCAVGSAIFFITAPESHQAAPPPQVDKPAAKNVLRPSTAKVEVTPILGPQMNGVGIGGTF